MPFLDLLFYGFRNFGYYYNVKIIERKMKVILILICSSRPKKSQYFLFNRGTLTLLGRNGTSTRYYQI